MKTIIEKLNLTKYSTAALVNLSTELTPLFADLPHATGMPKQPTDLIIVVAMSLAEMNTTITHISEQHLLTPQGRLFIAYPKLTSPKYADQGIHRDTLFPSLKVNETTGQVGKTTLKFSRMVALNADFTIVGLQLLTTTKPKKTDGRVDYYLHMLPQLKQLLDAKNSKASQQFETLTPGYQKDWARYVYSAKTTATQDKRFNQMIEMLNDDYASITLYRQGKKRH